MSQLFNKILKSQLEKLKFFDFVDIKTGEIFYNINSVENKYKQLSDDFVNLELIRTDIRRVEEGMLCIVEIQDQAFESPLSINLNIQYPSKIMFCKLKVLDREKMFCEIYKDDEFKVLTHELWIVKNDIEDMRFV